jgi:hypothetical protein
VAPHVFRFRAVQKSASLRPLRGGVEAGAKGWQCRPGGARDPALSSADFIMEKFDAGAHMARYTANTDPSGFAGTTSGAVQAWYESPQVEVDLVNPSTGHVLSRGTEVPFKIGFEWDAFW